MSKKNTNLSELMQKAQDVAMNCDVLDRLHKMPAQVLKMAIMGAVVESIKKGVWVDNGLMPDGSEPAKGRDDVGFAIDCGFDAIGVVIMGTLSKEKYDAWLNEATSRNVCDDPDCHACHAVKQASAVQPVVKTMQ